MAQPIREYLRGRSDTIKCLVSMVTQVGAERRSTALHAGAAQRVCTVARALRRMQS